MLPENFLLRWNGYEKNLSQGLRSISNDSSFHDVTLVSDGPDMVRAHKVILSACSPFFREILRQTPHHHPLLYLRGIKVDLLKSVLNFIYLGEVSVSHEDLDQFLSVAADLKISGLSEDAGRDFPKDSQISSNTDDKSNHRTVTTKRESGESEETPPRTRSSKRVKHDKDDEDQDQKSSHSGEDSESYSELVQVKSELIEYENDDKLDANYGDSASLSNITNNFEKTGELNQYLDKSSSSISAEGGYSDFLEEAMKTNCVKVNGGYSCTLCNKICRDLTKARQHLEAKHFPSVGYSCPKCGKPCKTKHAIACHMSMYHRDPD